MFPWLCHPVPRISQAPVWSPSSSRHFQVWAFPSGSWIYPRFCRNGVLLAWLQPGAHFWGLPFGVLGRFPHMGVSGVWPSVYVRVGAVLLPSRCAGDLSLPRVPVSARCVLAGKETPVAGCVA